jgi:hypothetical protein
MPQTVLVLVVPVAGNILFADLASDPAAVDGANFFGVVGNVLHNVFLLYKLIVCYCKRCYLFLMIWYHKYEKIKFFVFHSPSPAPIGARDRKGGKRR